MPDDFIPLAERVGLINSITNWVLNSAARQSKKWLDSGLNLTVAVNVSVRSFQEASQDIVDDIGKVLSQFNVPPKCLELEITESLLMSDVQGISRSLVSINELGVRVAIDDFGTGYSSLAYLKSLPVSAIKIDKSFVMNMVKDDDDATIVQSTIAMAHNLGFNVIAEGVEDIETLNKLRHMGCDGGQGYYFSKPLPASEFEAWLADFARKKVVHIDEFHI